MGDTEAWFHGALSAPNAEALLKQTAQDGLFLVRVGDNGEFVLSMVFKAVIYHIELKSDAKRKTFIVAGSIFPAENLSRLIESFFDRQNIIAFGKLIIPCELRKFVERKGPRAQQPLPEDAPPLPGKRGGHVIMPVQTGPDYSNVSPWGKDVKDRDYENEPRVEASQYQIPRKESKDDPFYVNTAAYLDHNYVNFPSKTVAAINSYEAPLDALKDIRIDNSKPDYENFPNRESAQDYENFPAESRNSGPAPAKHTRQGSHPLPPLPKDVLSKDEQRYEYCASQDKDKPESPPYDLLTMNFSKGTGDDNDYEDTGAVPAGATKKAFVPIADPTPPQQPASVARAPVFVSAPPTKQYLEVVPGVTHTAPTMPHANIPELTRDGACVRLSQFVKSLQRKTNMLGEPLSSSIYDGYFLIRKSTTQAGQLVLSYIYRGTVYHYNILNPAPLTYTVMNNNVSSRVFEGLDDLIAHYSSCNDGTLFCRLMTNCTTSS